jgi:hypothetical protein
MDWKLGDLNSGSAGGAPYDFLSIGVICSYHPVRKYGLHFRMHSHNLENVQVVEYQARVNGEIK